MLAVFLDAGAPLGGDGVTKRPGAGVDAIRFQPNLRSEHIQIVDVAQLALHLSEAFIPLSRSLRQEDFNGVAEAL
jgi:hypothetical protein